MENLINGLASCAPPVGSYDPLVLDKVQTALIDSKDERFKEPKPVDQGVGVGQYDSSSFKVPTTPKKCLSRTASRESISSHDSILHDVADADRRLSGRPPSVGVDVAKTKEFERQIRMLVQERNELHKRVQLKGEELLRLDSKLQQTVREKTSLSTSSVITERELAELKKSSDIIKAKMELHTKARDDLQAKLDLAQAKIDQLQLRIRELDMGLSNQIRESEDAMNTAHAFTEKLLVELANSRSEQAILADKVAAGHAKVTELERALSEEQRALEARNSELRCATEEANASHEETCRLQNEVAVSMQRISELERDIVKGQEKITSLDADLLNAQEEKRAIVEEFASITESLKRSESDREIAVASLNNAISENSRLETELSCSTSKVTYLQASNEEQQSIILQREAQIARLERALSTGQDTKRKLESESADSQAMLERLETELCESQEKIARYITEEKLVKERIIGLETEVVNGNARVACLDQELNDARATISHLEAELEASRVAYTTLSAQHNATIMTLQGEMEDDRNTMSQLQGEAQIVRIELEQKDELVVQMSEQNDSLTARLAQLEQDFQRQMQALAVEHQAEVVELEVKLANARTELIGEKSELQRSFEQEKLTLIHEKEVLMQRSEALSQEIVTLNELVHQQEEDIAQQRAEHEEKLGNQMNLLDVAILQQKDLESQLERKEVQIVQQRDQFLSKLEAMDLQLQDQQKQFGSFLEEKDGQLAELKQQLESQLQEKEMQLSDKIKQLESQLEEKDGQLAQLKQQLESQLEEKDEKLTKLKQQLESQLEEKELQLSKQTKQLESMLNEKEEELSEQIKQLESQLEEKGHQIKQQTEQLEISFCADREKFQCERAELILQNEQLVQSKILINTQLEELTDALNEQRKELETCKRLHEETVKQLTSEHEKLTRDTRVQIDTLLSEVSTAESRINTLEIVLLEKDTAMEGLCNEITTLRISKAEAVNEITIRADDAEHRATKAIEALQRAREQNAQTAECHAARLDEAERSLERQRGHIVRVEAEREQCCARIKELERTADGLRDDLSRVRRENNETIDELASRITEGEKKAVRLEEQVNSTRAERDSVIAGQAAFAAHAERDAAELRSKISKLTAEMTKMTDEHAAWAVDAERKIERLRGEMATIRGERDAARTEYAVQSREVQSIIESLREEIAQDKLEREELVGEHCALMMEAKSVADSLKDQLSQINDRKLSLEVALADRNTELANKNQQIQVLTESLACASSENDKLTARLCQQIEDSNKNITALNAKLEKALQEVARISASANDEVHRLEQQHVSKTEECVALMTSNASLKSYAEEADVKAAEMRSQLAGLQEKLSQIEKKNREWYSLAEKSAMKFRESEQHVAKLVEEGRAHDTRLTAARQVNEKLGSELKRLAAELSAAKQTLVTKEQEEMNSMREITSLQSTVSRLRDMLTVSETESRGKLEAAARLAESAHQRQKMVEQAMQEEMRVNSERNTKLIDDKNRQLTDVETKYDSLLQQLNETHAKAGHMKRKYEERLEQVQSELNHVTNNSDLQKLSEDSERWKKMYQDLWTKVKPFQEQLEAYELERQALEGKSKNAQQEIEKLSQNYAKLLGHQNQKQKIHHILKLKEDNNTLRSEVQELQAKDARSKKQISALTEKLDALEGKKRFDTTKAFQSATRPSGPPPAPLREGNR